MHAEKVSYKPGISRLLLLAALEGAAALAWLLAASGADSPGGASGMSTIGLAVAGFTLAASLVFLILAAAWGLVPGLKRRLEPALAARFSGAETLIPLVISLILIALLGAGVILWQVAQTQTALVFYYAWLGNGFSLFNSLVKQSLPVFAWITLLAVEFLGWVSLHRWRVIANTRYWRWPAVGVTLLVWLMGLFTAVQWLVLVFRLTAFTSIPGWHWTLNTKPVTARHLVFGLLLAAALACAYWLFGARWQTRGPKTAWRGLLALALLGISIQAGIGFLDGKGLESLREKYYSTQHRSYTVKATSRDESVLESIRRYEEIYSNMLFPSTKPPGVMAIYIGMERTLNAITRQTSQEARYTQLASFIGYTFPLLSMAAVFMIYFYIRRFFFPGAADTDSAAFLAPLLFIIAPNIVLLPLFLDQALYPTLFLAAAIPVLLTFQKQSLPLAFLTGVCLYTVIFFSFSLLPIFALPVLYAVVQTWLEPSKASLLRGARLLLGVAAGVACTFFAFQGFFHYDLAARYSNAMSVVYNYDFYSRIGVNPGDPVSLGLRIQQVFSAALLNNLDFASLVGFPVFILFVLRGVKTLLAILRRTASAGDAVQGIFFLAYLALNAIGQMNGEAGRLWMYWVPVVVSLAAIEIAPLVRRKPLVSLLLVSVQMITLLLTYQFQDLIF